MEEASKDFQSWTESLRIESIPTIESTKQQNPSITGSKSITFNIASFNVLAESYTSPRSHKNLPESFAAVAFDSSSRQALLCQTLERLVNTQKFDILCLQELDFALLDSVFACFDRLGYGHVYAPRGSTPLSLPSIAGQDDEVSKHETESQEDVRNDETGEAEDKSIKPHIGSSIYKKKKEDRSNVRTDGCATFYNLAKWKCVRYEVINFDDLADENRLAIHKNDQGNDELVNEKRGDNDGTHDSKGQGGRQKKKKTVHALSGMIASYRRRNAALVVELERVHSSSAIICKNIIVVNAHLYWHPGYEYVKLSQAHYLLHKVKQFSSKLSKKKSGKALKDSSPAIIVCGDMNSKPNSVVHQYFTKGTVDARKVAPWHFQYDEAEEQEELAREMQTLSMGNDIEYTERAEQGNIGYADGTGGEEAEDQDPIVNVSVENQEDDDNVNGKTRFEVATPTKKLDGWNMTAEEDSDYIDEHTSSAEQTVMKYPSYSSVTDSDCDGSSIKVKYMMDMTLNKFTRWLRILGVDAAIETVEEEKLRTGKEKKMVIFERCRKEKRILVTTSKTLLLRKDCPPGTYLVNPSCEEDLKDKMVKLLLLHGVTLVPKKFLTRCVVCNGNIMEVFDTNEKLSVLEEFGCSKVNDEDLEHVYRCNSCGQGYWWSSEPTSSASRVKKAASNLFRRCIRGGVNMEGSLDFFDYIDVEEQRRIGKEHRLANGDGKDGIDEVVSWLMNSELKSPFCLKSAYATESDGTVDGELLPFTNVTSDFVGALDYILFEDGALRQTGRLSVPTNFRTLNTKKIRNGHLLPSDCWPSDHLCIGAQFSLQCEEHRGVVVDMATVKERPDSTTKIASAYIPHDMKLGCDCGCVPPIPSLFQMAELRRQAQARKEAEKLKNAGRNETNLHI